MSAARKLVVVPPASSRVGTFHRTLLVRDASPGLDIADHTTIYADGTAKRIVGVLRLAITTTLTVKAYINGLEMVTITIPSATAIDTPVEVLAADFNLTDLSDGDVLKWAITTGDNQKNKYGVAAFTFEWA